MKKFLNRLNFRSFIFLVATFYLVYSLISAQFDLMTQKREYENVVQQKERLALEVDEIRSLLEEKDERLYIERIAREKLGYANPGEKVFVDIRAE